MTALNNDILDKMVKFSEFPQDLLAKLSTTVPQEQRQQFLADCEDIHKSRIEADAQLKAQQNAQ